MGIASANGFCLSYGLGTLVIVVGNSATLASFTLK